MNKELVTEVLIGSDPEMFLYSESLFKYIPVCGLVGGTKEEPLPITDKGHAIQEDNVAIEFCIPPCKTVDEFVDNINFVKEYIDDTILKPKGLTSKCVASAIFDEDDLLSPQAAHFGCTPSYNAWTGETMAVERNNPFLRTTGGHIHIGYANPEVHTSIELIKAMDLFLGLQSVLLDDDTARRQMYGKAGDYRLKKYGVEYRSLSSFWLQTDELKRWVFENTLKAINFVNIGGFIGNPDDIQFAINNCDKEKATEILNDYNIEVFSMAINK